MVQTRRNRKSAKEPHMKLEQPDRSGPTEKTLLDFAQDRDLFAQADDRQRELRRERGENDEDDEADDEGTEIPTTIDRVTDALFWAFCLATLHFSLDVLVQNQFGTEVSLPAITLRALRALAVFSVLVYVLHPHASAPILVPGLPTQYQTPIRQSVFFLTSLSTGCYLVYISNTYSYLAVMKQAPPLGCLWIWSVIEMNLIPAAASLLAVGSFMYAGGYTYK